MLSATPSVVPEHTGGVGVFVKCGKGFIVTGYEVGVLPVQVVDGSV